MKLKKLFLPLLIFVMACSSLIPEENLDLDQKYIDLLDQQDRLVTYCQKKTSFELVSSSKNEQNSFKAFLSRVSESPTQLNEKEKAIIWAFLQMNIRPELSSATAKFMATYQIGPNHNHTNQNYLEITSRDSKSLSLPYLRGLYVLRKKLGLKKSLSYYASLYDRYMPRLLPINSDFAKFLEDNSQTVKQTQSLRELFTRNGEILKEGESIKRLSMASLIKRYASVILDEKLYTQNTRLFEIAEKDTVEKLSCNYDFNLYQSSIYIINPQIINANFFGYKSSNTTFFFSSTQKIGELSLLEGTSLFAGQSKTQSPAFCLSESAQNKFWLFSEKSRDPGQHLFHIMNYGPQNLSSIKEFSSLIKFSRHLILRNPLRLIFEAERGTHNQLQELLKLNIPIYNSKKLGNLWGFYADKEHAHFISDPRNNGSHLCQK